MSRKMTSDEYLNTQSIILSIAKLVDGLDLEGFVGKIGLAPLMYPVIVPRLSGVRVADLKQMAVDLRALQKTMERIRERIKSEVEKGGSSGI